jgi:hypothetical protein
MKHEPNNELQMKQIQNDATGASEAFGAFEFAVCFLFRISDFGFRI